MSDSSIRRRHLRENYGREGQDVHDFHAKFLVPMANTPSFLDEESARFRIKFMQEELNEFIEGHHLQDMHKAADSLVDLVYVALGTALMMGIPWNEVWNPVQVANMLKRRAKPDGSDSKRKNPLDVIKPPGWTGPDHTNSLGVGPWPTFDAKAIGEQMAAMIRANPRISLRYDPATGGYIGVHDEGD